MNALLQGRYEIIQTLSAGGFGETFVALDRQLPSQRKVVIKKFKPQHQYDARTYEIVRERFEREAAVLESLSDVCRHVPKLYAFFSEAGDYYLVQEFIEGQTLNEFVRAQGRLDEATTRQLLTSLLEALHEIHAQGIIHRDIKPDNILLRAGNGQPVLIDFGAVKEIVTTVLDAYGTPQRASLIIGTPGYTPAEQSVGRPVYASDLYSLAMTMIFALTGRQPHELNDLASGELRWHQHTGKLSQPLTALLDQAIRYDYRERFKNAQEMSEALNIAPPPPQPAPVKPMPEPIDRTAAVDPTTMQRPTPTKPKPQPRVDVQPQPASPSPKLDIKPAGMPRLLKAVIGLGLAGVLIGIIYWSSNNSALGTPIIRTTTTTHGASVPAGKDFTETINGIKLEMKAVPAGSFLMGSPANEAEYSDDERPQHRVNVATFLIGKYEITQAQWRAVMNTNPADFKGDDFPVESVSWDDVYTFCRRLSSMTGKAFRLPTEAEWEYAARAGTTGAYAGELDAMAWHIKNSGDETHPVGQKKANAFGLYDMHGNVSEWCDDVTHKDYNGAPTDGSSWLEVGTQLHRVLRGGSWRNLVTNARSASRDDGWPGDHSFEAGLRVAVSARTP